MSFIKVTKPFFKPCVIIILIMAGSGCISSNTNGIKNKPDELREILSTSLKNEILNIWYPACLDSVNGGFLSGFSRNWTPEGAQDKMIVTQARHLWTASQAFHFFNDSSFYRIAQHGYNFLKQKMWDTDFGGFHMILDSGGNALINSYFDEKTAYGNSFAIYGLSGYYMISGDSSALKLAIETFQWLEEHSHDPVYKGYFDKMRRDGSLYTKSNSGIAGIELDRKQWKDYNSSIHLLEAFTELYKIWPDSLLKQRTLEMLELVRDTYVDERGFLKMHFERNWSHISYRDSTRSILKANLYFDHVSFGHDVETAYLLLEASHALKIPDDTITLDVAKKLVDHALAYGWDARNGGFYEMGYYYSGNQKPLVVSDTKIWWVQAEGLNSLLLMATLFPNEPRYYEDFLLQWHYIDKYLIDHKHGEWYIEGIDNSPMKKYAPKATIWKVNYHNTRALINCIHVLNIKFSNTPPK